MEHTGCGGLGLARVLLFCFGWEGVGGSRTKLSRAACAMNMQSPNRMSNPLVPAARDAVPASTRALDVIVVDDHDASRTGLEKIVRALGHHCRAAADGRKALEMHIERPAEVIISDWMMPNMDGAELCRRVRELASPDDAYTYFIFLTALGDRDHALAGIAEGADEYLPKPVDTDLLGARLLSAERVTRLHRELASRADRHKKDSKASFELARTDALTRTWNRLRFEEDFPKLAARVARHGHGYALALVDIDHFKAYNDTFGHVAGDDALRRVALGMAQGLRTSDVIYRYGGEEFAVVFAGVGADEARTAAERLVARVRALGIPHAIDEHAGVVTISCGVTMIQPGDRATTATKRADEALYRAKSAGRNGYVFDEG